MSEWDEAKSGGIKIWGGGVPAHSTPWKRRPSSRTFIPAMIAKSELLSIYKGLDI